jgi:hypothetical protein
VLESVQEFLGLEVRPELGLPHANPAKTNRSRWLARLLYRPPAVVRVPLQATKQLLGFEGTGLGQVLNRLNRQPVRRRFDDAALKQELRAFFADDVRLLVQLSGWDLDAWLPR